MAEIIYFEKTGPANTASALKIALNRYQAGGIDAIVLASTFGETALAAMEIFAPLKTHLIVVGELLKEGKSPSKDICRRLKDEGHEVIWGTHFNEMSTFTKDSSAALVSNAYYRISEGFKVCSEIVLMSASQGFLKIGEKVISIAGTHRGADTVIVAKAAAFSQFNDFEILEILCKPYQRIKEE